MASKPSRTTNFKKKEKLLLATLGRDFPEVESKGYDSKTLAKTTNAWEEIWTKFNSQNVNSIKHDLSFKNAGGGWNSNHKRNTTYIVLTQEKLVGGKAPVSPSEVSKLETHVIPALSSTAGIWWWCRRRTWFKARQRRDGTYYMQSGAKSACHVEAHKNAINSTIS